jgi:hypothetical protein
MTSGVTSARHGTRMHLDREQYLEPLQRCNYELRRYARPRAGSKPRERALALLRWARYTRSTMREAHRVCSRA